VEVCFDTGQRNVVDINVELLLVGLVVFAWSFGAFLQWRNIRHQEQLISGLQRLCLDTSHGVAKDKAPQMARQSERSDLIMRKRSPVGSY
jgi:hypothetical protein